MVITYHGGECFKVSFGDTVLAFNPIAKTSTLTPVKFGADVALITLNHPDCNGVAQVAHGNKQPFIIDGPGAYEVGDITVRGWGVSTTYEGVSRINTVYKVQLEGMELLFLGALGNAELDPAILGALGDVDVLFVPIGGGDVLEVPAASKLATKLEAKVVIPMHYDAAALNAFLKEEGKQSMPREKLTLKKKDLLTASGDIIVLTA